MIYFKENGTIYRAFGKKIFVQRKFIWETEYYKPINIIVGAGKQQKELQRFLFERFGEKIPIIHARKLKREIWRKLYYPFKPPKQPKKSKRNEHFGLRQNN
jgi:hypothetical protein